MQTVDRNQIKGLESKEANQFLIDLQQEKGIQHSQHNIYQSSHMITVDVGRNVHLSIDENTTPLMAST